MKKSFMRSRRFFVAVLLASIYSVDRFSIQEILASIRMLFTALFSGKNQKVDGKIYFKRMRHCMKCPLWVGATMTCGSPIVTGESGCYCYLPKKNSIPSATCWANENTDLNFGWPNELTLPNRPA